MKTGELKERLVSESYGYDRDIFFSNFFSKKEKEQWVIKRYFFLWKFSYEIVE